MAAVRGHREGTIYLRRDNLRWTAAVSMPDGSRPTLACHHDDHRASDRRACDEAKANLVELLRLRQAKVPAESHLLTLGQFLQGWLDRVEDDFAPATYRKHESICRVIRRDALSDLRLSELSVAAVQSYLQRAAAEPGGRTPRTVAHHRATLRRALADGLRDGLVTRNVAALARPPKIVTTDRTILDADECRTLIDGTRSDPMHAFYSLALSTGMREAEMLGLTWSNVDFDRRTVTVESTLQRVGGAWELRPPKTDRSRRIIDLPEQTIVALRAHKAAQLERKAADGKLGPDGLVFTTSTGRPIHGSNLLPAFRQHLARLGLPRITIHDLRHSSATWQYALGVPLPVIADRLGHSTIRVTADLYRHRVPALSRDAADRLEAALA